MTGTIVEGVCVKCGQACAVVVQDKRTVSACCEADAVEDGGLFIIDAAELRRRSPANAEEEQLKPQLVSPITHREKTQHPRRLPFEALTSRDRCR